MTIKESRAFKYALWCCKEDNHFVGIYVKKQAKAWIDIVNGLNDEAYICEKTFKKICKILKPNNIVTGKQIGRAHV